jgi:ribosomal protein S18 acetylase RimI-like enzyme
MNIEVRTAQNKDAAAILKLIGELAESIDERSPLTIEYILSYLATPGSTVLLAENDGNVLGLLSSSLRPNLYHGGNSCLIEELVVDQSVRGQGVGGLLLDALLESLQAKECAEVSVSTMPDNLGALKFYKTHGFVDEAIFLEKHF